MTFLLALGLLAGSVLLALGVGLWQRRTAILDAFWEGLLRVQDRQDEQALARGRIAARLRQVAGGQIGPLAVGEYKVLDGDGLAKFFKTASGTGVTGDAWVPLHSVDDNGGSLTVDVGTALPAGTANIGDVDVLTLPALPAGTNNIGDVDVLTIAAGDNNIGNVDIVTLPALVAGTANIGDVDVLTLPLGGGKTVLTAVGNASASGDNTAISAPGAGALYIFGYALQATGTVNGKFTDGAAGTQKTLLWTLQAREGISRQVAPPGYLFKLSATTALILNLSAAVGMGYEINYWNE